MTTDLTVGKPSQKLFWFSIPLLLSVAFQQLYQMADSIIVGRFAETVEAGELALAAVGASYPITQLFVAVATGINIGTGVLVSQLFGAKRYLRMKTAISTALLTTTTVALLLTLIGAIGTHGIMNALSTPENIFADGSLYLRVYVFGLLFLFIYNVCTGIFNAMGDSRTPLILLVLSSVGNVILDMVFVAGLHWGVAGVAWATFAAQGAASVLAFLTLLHRIKQLRSTEPYAKFSAEMLVQVTIVAIPSILQQCFVSIGNLFVQSAVNSYGSAVVAGFSACQKLNTFAVTCMTTLSNGVSSFTAQNLGADKKERISEGFRAGTLLGILVCVPFFLFYFFFGRTAMGLFLDESSAAAIQAGVDYMHIVTPFYFIVTIKVMCDGVLRGGSAMLYFMTTTFTDLFLRVALAFLFAKGLGLGATGIWMAWPFGWTLSALLSIFFYRLKPWLKKEL